MFCGGIRTPPPEPFGPKIYEAVNRLFWSEVQSSKNEVSSNIGAPDAGTGMMISIKKDMSCNAQYDEETLVCGSGSVEEAPWMASAYVDANYKNTQISYQIPFCYGSSVYRLHASPDGTSYLLSADGKTKLAEINTEGIIRRDEKTYNIPQPDLSTVVYSVHTFLGIKNPGPYANAHSLNYCGNRKWWVFQICDRV